MYNLIKKGRILGMVVFRHTDFVFVLNRLLEKPQRKTDKSFRVFFHTYICNCLFPGIVDKIAYI